MKNSIVKFIFLFFIFISSQLSFALEGGTETGNGGDVYVCKNDNNEIERVELLDYYEGSILYKFDFDSNLNLDNFHDIVIAFIERIRPHFPNRADYYQSLYNRFFEESLIIDVDLTDIPDSYHRIIPRGCELVQIAIQEPPRTPDYPYYIIDQKLWESLDAKNKAGLILHEIIYRDAIKRGHQDSRFTRELVAWIASSKFPLVTREQLYDRFRENNFIENGESPIPGLWFLEDETFLVHYANGNIKCGIAKGSIPFQNSSLKILSSRGVNSCLHRNAKFKSTVNDETESYDIQLGRRKLTFSGLKLNSKGQFVGGFLKKATAFQVGTQTIQFKDEIKFYDFEPSKIEFGRIDRPFGKSINIKQGKVHNVDSPRFYKNGHLKSTYTRMKWAYQYLGAEIKTLNININLKTNVRFVNFFPNGMVETLWISDDKPQLLTIAQQEFFINAGISFFSNGAFKSGKLQKNSFFVIEGLKREIYASRKNSIIEFDQQQKLRIARFVKTYKWQTGSGELIECKAKEQTEFYENYKLKSCVTTKDYILKYQNKELIHKSGQPIKFDEFGNIIGIHTADDVQTIYIGTDLVVFKGKLELYPNRKLKWAHIHGDFTQTINNKTITFGTAGEFEEFSFHDNGIIKQGMIAETKVLNVRGGYKLFRSWDKICFDTNENAALYGHLGYPEDDNIGRNGYGCIW